MADISIYILRCTNKMVMNTTVLLCCLVILAILLATSFFVSLCCWQRDIHCIVSAHSM